MTKSWTISFILAVRDAGGWNPAGCIHNRSRLVGWLICILMRAIHRDAPAASCTCSSFLFLCCRPLFYHIFSLLFFLFSISPCRRVRRVVGEGERSERRKERRGAQLERESAFNTCRLFFPLSLSLSPPSTGLPRFQGRLVRWLAVHSGASTASEADVAVCRQINYFLFISTAKGGKTRRIFFSFKQIIF